jgi:hypothetical protein
MEKRPALAIAFGLGVAAWVGVSAVGPGATPLDSGPYLLAALGAAGLVVALLQGELAMVGLLALYAGQAAALCGQALLGSGLPDAPPTPPVPLQLLYLLSFNLATALGGVVPRLMDRDLSRFG